MFQKAFLSNLWVTIRTFKCSEGKILFKKKLIKDKIPGFQFCTPDPHLV